MRVAWGKLAAVLLMLQIWVMASPGAVRAQGPIASGEMLTGAITPIGDSDTWTFSANMGDRIIVRVGQISESGSFAPRVRIYSPSNVLLVTSSGAVAAEAEVVAASSGTFTATIDDAVGTSATGTYRVTLAETGAAVVVSDLDEGGSLENGAMHIGTISTGDLDVWTVTASAGEAIVVRMGETSVSTLTPWVRIYNPAGTPVGSIAAGSSGAAAEEATATAVAAGTYLVVVGDGTSGLGGVGDYRLTLAKAGQPVFVSALDEGGDMTNGAMHIGTISTGDLDVWKVTAAPGEAIVVRMGETSVSTLTPWVRIYNPAGTPVGNIAAGSSGAAAEEATATAVAAGTYLVVVGDGTSGLGGVGDYRLTLAKAGAPVFVSALDEGGDMTNGAMHIGTISTGDLDVWKVTAAAGEAIVVRMGETSVSTLTPWVRIYNPAGTPVGNIAAGSSGAAAEEATATAVAAGTYLVVVGDGTSGLGGVGDYRLTLAQTGAAVWVSDLDEGGPLVGLNSGFIDVGDLDLWTLSAVMGQTIHVTMEEKIVGSTLAPAVRLYRISTGALLASSSGPALAQVSVAAPATGTYLVVVGDGTSGLGASGPYWLAPAATTGVSETLQPAQLSLSPAFPSPFTTRTVFHFAVAQGGEASLRVYDAQGRLVRTLMNEPNEAAGRYEAVWDGRNDAGVEVGPGLYLARLDSGGRRQTAKVILTR